MLVYTDSVDFARTVLGRGAGPWSTPASEPPRELRGLVARLYGARQTHESTVHGGSDWDYLLLVEVAEGSHYDLLMELSRAGARLPDRVLCLAGGGERFHGYKGRAWSAPRGNTYLSAHLRPARAVDFPATSFTLLAALSVVDAIDTLPGLESSAGIKWVNDILIDDAKVGGVLAYTHSVGETTIGAVLGIGVNVETLPEVEPTPFVPRVGTLRGATSEPASCTQGTFFSALAAALDANYGRLLAGDYEVLLARYRRRSLVIGREVTLFAEGSGTELQVIAQGRAEGIGKDLGLKIEGYARPFSKGRLVLGRAAERVSRKS